MSNESKLGIFIFIVILIFFFFTINMGTFLFDQAQVSYKIRFKEVGTLEVGAPVKQAGFDIGSVNGLALKTIRNPTPVHYIQVEVKVNEEAIVASDSKATIQTLGMMGEKYVEIGFGSGQKAPPGSVIEGESPQEMDDLIQNAVNLTQEVGSTVRSLNSIFGNKNLQNNILTLVDNLEEMTDTINTAVGGKGNRFNKILKNTESASAGLQSLMATTEIFIRDTKELINENRESIYEMLSNANQTFTNTSKLTEELQDTMAEDIKTLAKELRNFSERLGTTLDQANQIFAKMDKLVEEDVSQSMSNIKETTDNAKKASSRLDNMMKQVQTEDGLLHDFIYDEELSQATKQTINRASDFVGGISGLWDRFTFETDILYYTEKSRFHDGGNHIRADMGLEMDLSDSIYMVAGGNNLGTSNDLELQFGYRWGPVNLHSGVKESEATLGIEWQVFKRWMMGLEGVGLTDSGEERIDVYSEFWLWENFYLLGGLQDVTDDVYPNMGLRLRF